MALLRLSPNIQEEILSGHDYLSERELRPVTSKICWEDQEQKLCILAGLL